MNHQLQSTVWRYYAFIFFKSLHFFSAVLVPFFTSWGGISLFEVQMIQTWFAFWLFILEVPTGAIADYLGRKYSLLLGALVTGIGSLIYGSVPVLAVFLIGEFLFALGMALTSGADQALLYDALKEQKREGESTNIFGKAHAFELTGYLIAAVLGGFLADRFGINAPMLMTSIPFFIATIIAWTIREPKNNQSVSEQTRYIDVAKKGWHYFRTHKLLRFMTLDLVGVSAATYFVIWLYQPLLQSLQFPIVYFGLVHAGLMLSELTVSSNFVFLERIVGSAQKYLSLTALVTGLAFVLTAVFPSVLTAFILIGIAGGFGVTRMNYMVSKMQKHIESEQRATVLSFVAMLRRLSYAVLNPVIGLIATLSLSWAFFVVGMLPLAVFFFSPLKKKDID